MHSKAFPNHYKESFLSSQGERSKKSGTQKRNKTIEMEGTYAKELLCMEIHLHGEVLPEGGEEPKGILKTASEKMGYLMSLC